MIACNKTKKRANAFWKKRDNNAKGEERYCNYSNFQKNLLKRNRTG